MEGRISSVLFPDRQQLLRRPEPAHLGSLSPTLSPAAGSYGGHSASRPISPKMADRKQADLERSISHKQAEIDRSHKQAELTHFQLEQVKEQLSNLSVEMARFRQDSESLHVTVRDMQSEYERETFSRRKDGEDFFNGLAQLRQFLNQQQQEYTQALQTIELEISDQAETVKLQLQQQVDATNSLSKSFESSHAELRTALAQEIHGGLAHLQELIEQEKRDRSKALRPLEKEKADQSQVVQLQTQLQQQQEEATNSLRKSIEIACADLRLAIDKESGERARKFEEVERECAPIVPNLEKEVRERHEKSVEELNKTITSVRVELEGRLERENTARKLEAESLVRGERHERKALGQRLEEKIKEDATRLMPEVERLDGKCADLYGMMAPFARHDEVQRHLKNFAERFNELVDSLSEVRKSQKCRYSELKDGFDNLSDVVRAGDSDFKHMLDILARNLNKDIERDHAWNSDLHHEHHNRNEQTDVALRKLHVNLHLITLRLSEQQREE